MKASEPLEKAYAAAAAEDWVDCLEQLLLAWRDGREPQIADLIDRVSKRAEKAFEPLRAPRLRDLQNIWLERAKDPAPGEIPHLLDRLMDVRRIADLRDRGPLVERWKADPRVARRLAEELRVMRWRDGSSHVFWRSLFRVIESARDYRCVAILRGLGDMEARLGHTGTAGFMSRLVVDALDHLQERSEDSAPTCSGPDAARVESIAVLLQDPDEERALRQRAGELLARIIAEPDDDSLRLVYGDVLTQLDDPRGEFITLQFQRKDGRQSRDGRRREKALLAAHKDDWLGPLAQILRISDAEFERGFLASARVRRDLSAKETAHVVGHPFWATVEEFHGPDDVALDDSMRSLRRVSLTTWGLTRIAMSYREFRFESVTWTDGPVVFDSPSNPEERNHRLASLLEAARFLPRLRQVTLRGDWGQGYATLHPDNVEDLKSHELIERLERLSLWLDASNLVLWRRAFDQAALPELELVPIAQGHPWGALLSRDPDGNLSQLTLMFRGTDATPSVVQAASTLREVEPGELTRIRIVAPRARPRTEGATMLKAAARDLGLELSDLPHGWPDGV